MAERGLTVHSLRRSFISLARTDGARADVLKRVTHNARGAIIDTYTTFEWGELCDAVGDLKLAEKLTATVVPISPRGYARR